jgi:hypothetical protein
MPGCRHDPFHTLAQPVSADETLMAGSDMTA